MKIIVPEDIGGELKVLPEGTCRAVVADMFYGLSEAQKPKMTIRWQLTSDIKTNGGQQVDAVGENVLDSYSLQSQALWRINALYKSVTGESIPHGDYSPEEFTAMLRERLQGEEFALVLYNEIPPGHHEERTRVEKAVHVK